MSREKELVKNTGILSLGAFVPKLIAIIVTPILTSQLTKTEFGIYDLIVTIVSLLMPAVTLEITSAAFRFLIDKKNNIDDSREIISLNNSFKGLIFQQEFAVLFLSWTKKKRFGEGKTRKNFLRPTDHFYVTKWW